MGERDDTYLKNEIDSEIDKFLSKSFKPSEKRDGKKRFEESTSSSRDVIRASKSSTTVGEASTAKMQERTWPATSFTGSRISSQMASDIPSATSVGSRAAYASGKWRSTTKTSVSHGENRYPDDGGRQTILEGVEPKPYLVRGSTKRKSTIKSLGKFLMRYLGLKENSSANRRNQAFRASQHHFQNNPGTSLNIDSKRDSTDRKFSSSSTPRSRRRFSSVRVKSEENWSNKSSSRTSLLDLNDDSWRKRHDFTWGGHRDEEIKERILKNDEYRNPKETDNHRFYKGEKSTIVKEKKRQMDEDDSGVDSPVETKFYSDFSLPCLKGIRNVGNTCFINSILQCLAAIDNLAEYFLSNKFSRDLKNKTTVQQLNAQRFGSDGLLSNSLAKILRALWFNESSDSVIRDFRCLIAEFNENYRMSIQQDAQELLIWLLDMIHEDLNMGTARKYSSNLKSCESEEDLAESARDNHLRVHRSTITGLFGAQFRSSIQCSSCRFTKLNFDPYMCVSLQVPQDTRKPVFVTVSSSTPRSVVRFGLKVERGGKVSDVKDCISAEVKIPTDRLFMLELNYDGIHSVVSNSTSINDLNSNELNAVAVPACNNSVEEVCIVFVIAQLADSVDIFDSIRLSEPFICRIQQHSSYQTICLELLRTIDLWKPHFYGAFDETLDLSPFSIRIVDGASIDYLKPNMVLPLHSQAVLSAISSAMWLSGISLPILPVVMEFRKSFFNFDPLVCDSIVFHQSCEVLEKDARNSPATLEDCLNEFTSAETIEWCCEKCISNEAEKILKFRSLPNILVFHLKRFRQLSDGSMVKLDRNVNFPVNGLDMSPYVYSCGVVPMAAQMKAEIEITGKRGFRNCLQGDNCGNIQDETLFVDTYVSSEYIYDLFAIVYHRGETVNSGHYTSSTRNPIDGKWRLFDDHLVQLIDPSEITTLNTSYLLFYERRAVHKHSSSGHSSTESGIHDHWFNRLCAENRKKILVSSATVKGGDLEKKHDDCNSDNKGTFHRNDVTRVPLPPSHRSPPFSSNLLSAYSTEKHNSEISEKGLSEDSRERFSTTKFNLCTNTIV